MKIVVIGAGLGGLTFGALAARDGHQVEIFDKNGAPGGVVALLEHEGFKFEQGPLLIGDMLETEPVYEFLKTLGITLETERADRGIVMPDYDMIHPDEYAGPYWRREKLKKLFPEQSKGIDAYYRLYEDVLEVRWLSMQPKSFANELKKTLKMLKLAKYAKMNVDELTKHFFRDERICTLFRSEERR